MRICLFPSHQTAGNCFHNLGIRRRRIFTCKAKLAVYSVSLCLSMNWFCLVAYREFFTDWTGKRADQSSDNKTAKTCSNMFKCAFQTTPTVNFVLLLHSVYNVRLPICRPRCVCVLLWICVSPVFNQRLTIFSQFISFLWHSQLTPAHILSSRYLPVARRLVWRGHSVITWTLSVCPP